MFIGYKADVANRSAAMAGRLAMFSINGQIFKHERTVVKDGVAEVIGKINKKGPSEATALDYSTLIIQRAVSICLLSGRKTNSIHGKTKSQNCSQWCIAFGLHSSPIGRHHK